MARSKTRSIRVPHPIADALELQLQNKVIDYDNINAATLGLMVYQLIVARSHPITSEIMRMPVEDQDCIYDFLLEMTRRQMSLKGQLLNAMIHRAMGNAPQISLERIAQLQAPELLALAKRWKAKDETVWEDVDMRRHQG